MIERQYRKCTPCRTCVLMRCSTFLSPLADDFMDHVEDSEEETGTGDYDQLAAAMAADGLPASTSSESEQEEGGTSGEGQEEEEHSDRVGSQSDGEDA